jgi:hypothetical protein
MTKWRGKTSEKRPLENQRRLRISFAERLSLANRRAYEEANRRGGRRDLKSVQAVLDAADLDEEMGGLSWVRRVTRWLVALLLLPFCWVTMWTLLSRLSHATTEQDFWKAPEFWYFSTGALVMVGWFWSGLFQSFFLYIYVLGHELTHAVFVVIFRGKVTDIHVSTQGGYITTNKTNLLIALSPYFVPFWAVVCAILYGVLGFFVMLAPAWDLAFYGVMGMAWTFHMVWTVWMLPRDQPDLQEHGTLLSLVVIYLANLLVLVVLLCLAEDSPWSNTRDFGMEWLRHAVTWGDALWRAALEAIWEFRVAGKF